MNPPRKRLAALYLGAVFAAGLALGAVSHWFYAANIVQAEAPRPRTAQELRQRLIANLDEELHFTPEQLERIRVIFDEVGKGYHRIHDEVEPKYEALRQKRAKRVMALLTPEQQLKYREIIEERRQRRKEKNREWWNRK